ncbi:MAG: hypothetical protein J6U53_01720 [Tidjanibacter sp.]|nr:hypothetical protein [Tidjanibacter sp.]
MRTKHLFGKILLIGALLIASLTSCTHRNWNEQQRREAREMLRQWREIAYLNDLSEEEFALFAGNVADILEMEYPSYVEFVEMPMVGDSVEMVIIATITTDLKASPERLRHIFRYDDLVELGTLPAGLTLHQQNNFYRCFAERVNMTYGSLQRFVWDAVYSTLDDLLIAQMLRHCAAPFWDGEIDTVVIED